MAAYRLSRIPAGFALLVIFSLLAGLAGCQQEQEEEEERPRAVTTITPETADVTRDLTFPARLRGVNSSVLSFSAGGVVEEVLVEQGARVEQGDLLARLDSDELAASASAARADLQAARQRLNIMQTGARQEEIAQLESRLASARESHRVAEAEHRRVKRLFEEGVVSRSRLDGAEASLKQAEAELENAKQALEIARQGARQEEVEEQRDRIDAAQARYQSASARLDNHRLRAPFAGVLARNHLEVGEYISPDQPAVELVETDRLEAEFQASVSNSQLFSSGDQVTVEGDSGSSTARIHSKADAASPQSGLVPVKVRLESSDLTPGDSVEVRIRPVLAEQVLTLPQSAVLSLEEDPFVLVVENGQVAERSIETGARGSNRVEITSGLEGGEEVISEGQAFLQIGQEVRITDGDSTGGGNQQEN